MTARRAREDEIATWQQDGWVLLEGLIGTDEIDAATADLWGMYPTPEAFHADPNGETERWKGRPAAPRDEFVWPADGPGFRPEQHRWNAEFPWTGSGALNRLSVHPSIVDFAERALETTDLRLYQVHSSAKYTGVTNYEQPMHTDRNHSWLPPRSEPPWWHLETFLYLSDVHEGVAPTHVVSLGDSTAHVPTELLVMPKDDPALYAAEQAAKGGRGSLLAYRTDVFHRGVNLTEPGGSRFLMALAFRAAGQDWIGYQNIHSRANSLEWGAFVEGSTPRELELFGFPPPGHPVWDAALLDATAVRYPKLDLGPWRDALPSAS